MKLKKLNLGLIALSVCTHLYSYEMRPVGFKATSLGGAGVASTSGSLVTYYNPALLKANEYDAELSVNLGVRFRETNIAENIDGIANANFATTIESIATTAPTGNINSNVTASGNTITLANGTTYTVTGAELILNNMSNGDSQDLSSYGVTGTLSKENDIVTLNVDGTDNSQTTINNLKSIQNILANFTSDNALQVSLVPSFSAQFSNLFAIGYYAYVDAGIQLVIDNERTQLIVEDSGNYYKYDPDTDIYSTSTQTEYEATSLEYAFNNNLSYINAEAMILKEMPVSLAMAGDIGIGYLGLGTNFKMMELTTYSQRLALGTSSDGASESSDNDSAESTYKDTIGIDLGVAFQPMSTNIMFGLVAKNINSPKFEVQSTSTGASDYKIDPFFRAGVSIPFLEDTFEFALDVDLQKSDTIIDGEKTQNIGGGVEYHPVSWFSLRGGLMQDMASEKFDDGLIYTAGFGLGLKWVQIDVSAMMSSKSGYFDGNEIPRYLALNGALISRW